MEKTGINDFCYMLFIILYSKVINTIQFRKTSLDNEIFFKLLPVDEAFENMPTAEASNDSYDSCLNFLDARKAWLNRESLGLDKKIAKVKFIRELIKTHFGINLNKTAQQHLSYKLFYKYMPANRKRKTGWDNNIFFDPWTYEKEVDDANNILENNTPQAAEDTEQEAQESMNTDDQEDFIQGIIANEAEDFQTKIEIQKDWDGVVEEKEQSGEKTKALDKRVDENTTDDDITDDCNSLCCDICQEEFSQECDLFNHLDAIH